MVSSGDTTLGAVSSKMKILLLDSETVRVYGTAGSPDQSWLPSGFHSLGSNYAICTPQSWGLPHWVKLHRATSENNTDSACSRLDNVNREKMRHLRCICFVRPSAESVQHLVDEFREPKYGEYFICKTWLVVCLACSMIRHCALEAECRGKTLVTSSVNPLSSGWQKSTIRKW